MAELSPTTSVRRISDRVGASRMQVWRTFRDVGLHPFHVLTLQTLQPTDKLARVEFFHWLLENRQLHTKMLFTDEAAFNRDGTTNTLNSHIWWPDNPHASKDFQSCFSVTIWCGVIENQLIGQSVLEVRLISEPYPRFPKDELPVLLDIPLHRGENCGCNKMAHLSFRKAGDCISQSKSSKPLDWAAGSGCLATKVT
jgi:hypothetical protein